MKFRDKPYEETIRWFKKITHTGRSTRRKNLDLEDAFDVFEHHIVHYGLNFFVLVSAAVLETMMLPALAAVSLWEKLNEWRKEVSVREKLKEWWMKR